MEDKEKVAAKRVEGTKKFFRLWAYGMIAVGVFGKSSPVWIAGVILLVFSWMLGGRRP